ncbi:MAG: ferrous iron transport protein A [Lachnospirales bacterium]
MCLHLADIGTINTVKKVSGLSDVKKFLESLGIVIGARVTLVSSNNGNVIVDVKGSRVALSNEVAKKIFI